MGNEVHFEVAGHVALITLNRPEARNAINAPLARALTTIMQRVESDPTIQVSIITGAGEQAFSAGADLKTVAAGERPSLMTPEGGFAGIVSFPRTKPLLAAVNGFALGGGTEIALACDFAIAAEGAVFGQPEVTRGLIAGAGGLFRLPRAIPRGRAIELLLTGDRLSAHEALELGLVNHVVPTAELLPTARKIAERICANAPLAVRESLAILRRANELTEEEGWQLTRQASARIMQSEDAHEGPQAFAEKRAPRWTGR